MSGGSWEYVCHTFDDVANRLLGGKRPLRQALGKRIKLIATAMHDIEWVDSGDDGEGDEEEAIKLAIGSDWKAEVLAMTLSKATGVLDELRAAIATAKK